MLIESILRGIPLPSIILARGSGNQRFQIVDGKQRLTAILRFMGAHPEGLQNAKSMVDYASFEINFAQFARRNTRDCVCRHKRQVKGTRQPTRPARTTRNESYKNKD